MFNIFILFIFAINTDAQTSIRPSSPLVRPSSLLVRPSSPLVRLSSPLVRPSSLLVRSSSPLARSLTNIQSTTLNPNFFNLSTSTTSSFSGKTAIGEETAVTTNLSTSAATLKTNSSHSTRTGTATTTWPTTTTEEGVIVFDFCHSTSFEPKSRRIALILLYVSGGWVGAWSMLAILVNMCYGILGHHRMLNLVQEFGMIVTFLVMGVLVMRPKPDKLCEITSIAMYALMIFIILLSLMTASIARSLIRGGSSRNGRFPSATYYFWPVFLSIVIAVVVYFLLRKDFRTQNGVHCFSDIFEAKYWVYTITAGVLTVVLILTNQTAVVLCKMSRNSVNLPQLFWAKKTIRAEPLTIFGFLACYFCLMFAAAMQKLWLFGVYTGTCIIYGVMFFILHTYCYEETALKMHGWTHLYFYRPCAEVTKLHRPRTPRHRLLALKHKEGLANGNVNIAAIPTAPQIKFIEPSQPASKPVVPIEQSIPVAQGNAPTELPPLEANDTSAQDFYSWLTDPNEGNAENVLFRKEG